MKKLSIFAVAAVFGLFAVSCNNGGETTDEETKTEEVKADETQDEVVEEVGNMDEEIVNTEADENLETADSKTPEKEDVKPKAQPIKQIKMDEKEVAKKGEVEEKDNGIQL